MRIFIFLLVTGFGLASHGQQGSWQSLLNYSFPKQSFADRNGPRTNALLIWHKNKLALERYERGYTSEKKHILWSISKSLSSLLFAYAEKQGKAKRTDSICLLNKTLPEEHCDIRFQDLLQWTSGLKWLEEYETSERITDSSVIAMLFGQGKSDMTQFVLSHKKAHSPGQAWRYSSGDSHVLASLTTELFGLETIPAFKELFGKMGLSNNWDIELDGKAKAIGSANMYMTGPDLLKVGQFLLAKGKTKEEQILPKDWIQFLSTVPQGFKNERLDHENDASVGGASFWLNKKWNDKEERPWPTAPADTYVGRGHWGQYLIVIPSLNLTAVRFGDTRDKSFTLDKMIELLVEGARGV